MEDQPDLQNIPPETIAVPKRRKRQQKSFFRKNWFTICLTTAVLTWELGVNVSLQKGFLDETPDWCVFLMLAVPVMVFVLLALLHPSVKKHYGWLARRRLITIPAGFVVVGGVACLVWCLFNLTHPKLSPNFEFFVNGSPVTNGSAFLLPKDRKISIAVKNRSQKSLSGVSILFTPGPLDSKYFSAPYWIIAGSGVWVEDGKPTRKSTVYLTGLNAGLPNDEKFSSGAITFSNVVSSVKARIQSYAIGVKSEEVYVLFKDNN